MSTKVKGGLSLFTPFGQSKKLDDNCNLLTLDDPLEGQKNCKNKSKKPKNLKKLARLQEKGFQSLLM